jgi:hypothetical protein
MIDEKLDVLQARIEALENQMEELPEAIGENEFYMAYDELLEMQTIIQDEIYSIPVSELSEVSREILVDEMNRFADLEARIDMIKQKIEQIT